MTRRRQVPPAASALATTAGTGTLLPAVPREASTVCAVCPVCTAADGLSALASSAGPGDSEMGRPKSADPEIGVAKPREPLSERHLPGEPLSSTAESTRPRPGGPHLDGPSLGRSDGPPPGHPPPSAPSLGDLLSWGPPPDTPPPGRSDRPPSGGLPPSTPPPDGPLPGAAVTARQLSDEPFPENSGSRRSTRWSRGTVTSTLTVNPGGRTTGPAPEGIHHGAVWPTTSLRAVNSPRSGTPSGIRSAGSAGAVESAEAAGSAALISSAPAAPPPPAALGSSAAAKAAYSAPED